MFKTAKVLLPVPVGSPFDYAIPEGMEPDIGAFVVVPFGNKKLMGAVWGMNETPPDFSFKLKEIIEVKELPLFSEKNRRFAEWVAGYTLFPLGSVLKMALSVSKELLKDQKRTRKKTFETPDWAHSKIDFSNDQNEAFQNLKTDGFRANVLEGVTGSGKTEVYFEAIAEVLKAGKQALVLLPEIGLTGQWVTRFEKRFGVRPALWHSGLTPQARRETWLGVLRGEAKVLAGARSALFLPFSDLGLIIVDEEHDASYKQEDGVVYHARDMAAVRASIEKIPLILSSATPSLETVVNARAGKYAHVVLPKRFGAAEMPEPSVIDMRRHPPEKRLGLKQTFLSPVLVSEIEKNLAAEEQTLLFLNRRGYAPLVLCQKCGHRFCCPHCSSWLVEHAVKARLQCHHCGYSLPIPKKCPVCESEEDFASCGPGVERIYEEAAHLFPNARIAVLSSDTETSPAALFQMIEDIYDKKIDIVIGTQMLAKGHHFPDLTLVGVVDADLGLNGGDLRASERTYQLLHQVGGRAGRAEKKGRVFLQTYEPLNPVIQALMKNDRHSFLEQEIKSREMLKMPPFGRMAGVVVSGKDRDKTFAFARELAKAAPAHKDIRVLGPAPAPLSLLRGQYRFRLLLQTSKDIKIQDVITEWNRRIKTPSSLKVKFDIDPYSFM